MTFDQHKQHMADEYAAQVAKHKDLPAIKEYIWWRVTKDMPRPMYEDMPDLLTTAVKAQQEKPSEL